jgi:hypothetical protein
MGRRRRLKGAGAAIHNVGNFYTSEATGIGPKIGDIFISFMCRFIENTRSRWCAFCSKTSRREPFFPSKVGQAPFADNGGAVCSQNGAERRCKLGWPGWRDGDCRES